MKRVIHFTAKQLYWGGSIAAVCVGAFITVTRVLMPYLDTYRADFEVLAGDLLDRQVKIERISAWWEGVEPVFRFDHLNVLDEDKKKPLLEVGRLQVNIDIMRSLLHRRLEVDSLTIEGVSLKVHQANTGDLSVNGLSSLTVSDKNINQSLDVNELLGWLLTQPTLIFDNINVDWSNVDGETFPVSITSIGLHNSGNNHVLSGKLYLRKRESDIVEFNLDVTGNWREAEKMRAALYAHVSNIELPDWVGEYNIFDKQISEGVGAGKLWAWWESGRLTRAQLLFQVQNVLLKSKDGGADDKLNFSYGNLGWEFRGKHNWSLGGDHLLFSFPDHTSNVSQFQLHKLGKHTDHSKTELWINYLDLQDISRLFIGSAFLPKPVRPLLKDLSMTGTVRNIKAVLEGDDPSIDSVRATAHFDNLGFKPLGRMPGLKGFSGRLNWENGRGDLHILSTNAELTDNALFLRPIHLTYLQGDINVEKLPDEGYRIRAKQMRGNNHNVNTYLNASFDIPKEGSPGINLLASVNLNNLKDVIYYLPTENFSATFIDWMKQAFVVGKGETTVIWRGALGDHLFPYDAHPSDGTFALKGSLNDVDFQINHDWPVFKNVMSEVDVLGSHIKLKVDSGKVLNSTITSLTADIPKIQKGEAISLQLSGEIDTSGEDLLRYVKESPLKDNLGNVLKDDVSQGPAELNLSLFLPLERLGEDLKVFGELNLKGVDYKIHSWPFAFKDAHGLLKFNETGLLPSEIKAIFWNQPLTLAMKTYQSDNSFGLKGEIESIISMEDIGKYFGYGIDRFIVGDVNYRADFDVKTKRGVVDTTVEATSNLQGANIKMPLPLTKPLDAARELNLSLSIHDNQFSEIKYSYADAVKGVVKFKHNNFGGKITSTNALTLFHWSDWKAYLDGPSKGISAHKTTDMLKQYIDRVSITVGDLTIMGQSLSDALLSVSPKPDAWLLQIDSDAILGELSIPDKFTTGQFTGKFKQLHIAPLPVDFNTASDAMAPEILPAIKMDAKDFSFGKKQFGETHLRLVPGDNRIVIERLETNSPALSIDATGEWSWENESNKTHVAGSVTTEDLEALFKQWEYNSAVIGSTGQAVFDFSWPDVPYKVDFTTIMGTVSADMGSGHIVNVDDDTATKLTLGKFINLLSIETIAKRLTLNFSDMTKKGYYFNELQTNLIFSNNNLNIEKMNLDGVVADLKIAGRVGLIARDYDLILDVAPNYTGSLPIVAGIITVNPLVGVATWAVDRLIRGPVEKITSFHYTVEGPWAEPVVTQVSEKDVKDRRPVLPAPIKKTRTNRRLPIG